MHSHTQFTLIGAVGGCWFGIRGIWGHRLNVRAAIYLGYFGMNLAFIPDWSSILLVAPTFIYLLYRLSLITQKFITLDDILYFTYYLFFVIEPLQSIDHGLLTSYGLESAFLYDNQDIVTASLGAFLFIVSFDLVFLILGKKPNNVFEIETSGNLNMFLALLSNMLLVAYIVADGGISQVLVARYDRVALSLTTATLLAMIVLIALTILTSYQARRAGLVTTIFAVTPMIICCNPYNAPRFILISTYLPVLFVLLRGRLSTCWFYVSAFAGVIVVMPILNITSRYGSFSRAQDSAVDIGNFSPFRLQFIDVSDMMVYNVHYTANAGFTYGQKLLGDMLFFVPRAIWTWKPTLNGLDVGQRLYSLDIVGTDNLSMPIFGDGYRDFGLIGVILAAVLSATLLRAVFYRTITTINGLPVLQYIVFASIPILLRGPISAVVGILCLQVLAVSAARVLLAGRLAQP